MAALLLASLNSFSQEVKPTGRATDLLRNQHEPTYVFSEKNVIDLFDALMFIKKALPTTTMAVPPVQLTNVMQFLDSIQVLIQKQYANFHPDSTKPKK